MFQIKKAVFSTFDINSPKETLFREETYSVKSVTFSFKWLLNYAFWGIPLKNPLGKYAATEILILILD